MSVIETKLVKFTDETRIGEIAAQQPVSGVVTVDETFAVNGHGRGAYVRIEESDRKSA